MSEVCCHRWRTGGELPCHKGLMQKKLCRKNAITGENNPINYYVIFYPLVWPCCRLPTCDVRRWFWRCSTAISPGASFPTTFQSSSPPPSSSGWNYTPLRTRREEAPAATSPGRARSRRGTPGGSGDSPPHRLPREAAVSEEEGCEIGARAGQEVVKVRRRGRPSGDKTEV